MKKLKGRIRKGKSVPFISTRPNLRDDLWWVYNSFMLLSNKRRIGFGAEPIVFSEIVSWLDEYTVTSRATREYLIKLISAMDAAYIEFDQEQVKSRAGTKDGNRGTNKNSRTRNRR